MAVELTHVGGPTILIEAGGWSHFQEDRATIEDALGPDVCGRLAPGVAEAVVV